MVLLRDRIARRGLGAIDPCLPSPAKRPPAGPGWIHEIKHDGFRIMARLDTGGVRLITRNGNDLARRFPFIALAVAQLPGRSCVIDGEAIVCDERDLRFSSSYAVSGIARPRCSAVLISSNSTAKICAARRSRLANGHRKACCAAHTPASYSIDTLRPTGRLSTGKPAHLAARALCRSGSARRTSRADRRIG